MGKNELVESPVAEHIGNSALNDADYRRNTNAL